MPDRKISNRALMLLAAAMTTALVAGCRESEQDRPLAFEKGVYGGQQDQAISEETRDQLRNRVKLQSFN